jgi:hypothetical protein
MSDSELESRKKEVVQKTQDKANSIRDAIKAAEKIDKTGDEDVIEGLAYSISMLRDVDSREESLHKEINSKLGLSFSKDDFNKLKQVNKENKKKSRELSKIETKANDIRRNGYKGDMDEVKKNYSTLIKELKTLEKTTSDLNEKKESSKLLKAYGSDFDSFVNHLNTNEIVNKKLTSIKESNPEEFTYITELVNDLSELNNRRQDFISTYNNLYTEEGQSAFKNDIDSFKSYAMADLPEDITKHSATLTYYKALGQNIRKELSNQNNTDNNTAQREQDDKVTANNLAAAQSAVTEAPVSTPQPVQQGLYAQPAVQVEEPAATMPVEAQFNPFGSSFSEEEYNVPVEESLPVGQINSELDELYNQLGSKLKEFATGDNSISAGFDNQFERNLEFQKQVAPIIRSIVEQIEKSNPGLQRIDISNQVLNTMVSKIGLDESQYNLLKGALNAIIGRNKDADSINLSYAEFTNNKIEPKVVVTYDLADQQNNINNIQDAKKNIKDSVNDSVEYNHRKNTIPQLSLAYLSHNYKEGEGKIETTEANEAGKALLSLKQFNDVKSISGEMSLDNSNLFVGSQELLDHPVKIVLTDTKTNNKVTTYLHTLKWIIDIKDAAGNSIVDNDTLKLLTDLALSNDVKNLEKELRKLSGDKIEAFRNTGADNFQKVIDSFVELVNFRKSMLNDTSTKPIKINSISNGTISWNKEFQDATTALPSNNIQFGIVDQNGQVRQSMNNSLTATYTNDGLKPGEVVAMLPLKGNKSIPVTMRLKNVSTTGKKIFIAAIKEYLSDKPQSVKIKSNTLSLGKSKAIKKFLSIYSTFIPNMNFILPINLDTNANNDSLFGKLFIDFSDAMDEKGNAIQVRMLGRFFTKDNKIGTLYIRSQADLSKTVQELAKEQGLIVKISKNDVSKDFDKSVETMLNNYISNKLSTVEAEISGEQLLENDKVKTNIPIVDVLDGKLTISDETISYTEHVKSKLMTNVNGTNKISKEGEEEEYSYIEQPVFVMDKFPDIQTNQVVEVNNKVEDIFTEVESNNPFDTFEDKIQEQEDNIRAEMPILNDEDNLDFLFDDNALIITEQNKQNMNDKTDNCK